MAKKRLTYANVMSTLAVFLVLGGATAFAAYHLGRNTVGTRQLKPNAVSAAKLRANAVTTAKIKDSAVTTAKVADSAVTTAKIGDGEVTTNKLGDGAVTNSKLGAGAVSFANIAAGTDLIGIASGGPVAANVPSSPLVPIPLTGTTSFTPTAGAVDLVSIEARGDELRPGGGTCGVTVVPFVNGKALHMPSGFLGLVGDSAGETSPVPVASETGPLGIGQPGVPQQISMKLIGSPGCAGGSQVSVSVAVTQAK